MPSVRDAKLRDQGRERYSGQTTRASFAYRSGFLDAKTHRMSMHAIVAWVVVVGYLKEADMLMLPTSRPNLAWLSAAGSGLHPFYS